MFNGRCQTSISHFRKVRPMSYQNTGGTPQKLTRSMTDKMLAGVCGGVAQSLGIDATIVRVVFVLLALGGVFPGVLAYLICWFVMPPEF